MVQNLHTVLNYLARPAIGGCWGATESGKAIFTTAAYKCAKTANRQLATSPDSMDAKQVSRSFTNNTDIALVKKKYMQVFRSVGKARTTLGFSGMKWMTKKQWAEFCSEVLPHCTHLEELDLCGGWQRGRTLKYKIEEDIMELVGKLPPTLEVRSS